MIREDIAQIINWVPKGARVLDVGCGNGDLMTLLKHEKNACVQGIELEPRNVNLCIGKGLSVIQGDANTDLGDYPEDVFDMVVLSQTLQAMDNPKLTLRELGRIAPKVVVSIPNFAYWRGIIQLLFVGKMPMTKQLPVMWYETPNIHLCTITDLIMLAQREDFHVCDGACFDGKMRAKPWKFSGLSARLLATQVSLLLEKSS